MPKKGLVLRGYISGHKTAKLTQSRIKIGSVPLGHDRVDYQDPHHQVPIGDLFGFWETLSLSFCSVHLPSRKNFRHTCTRVNVMTLGSLENKVVAG